MIIKERFYIGYRDIATNLKIKNSAILNLFEDIASIHANNIGDGIKGADATWMLTAYKVKILKRPEYGEWVQVYTWGTEIKSITASREFEIRNEEGELLIVGLSNWVRVNIKDKKIEKVSDEIAEAYKVEPDRTNFNEYKLKKLTAPDDIEYRKEYSIHWNWIDANNHMNNIFYMDLADMVLPDELSKQNNFKTFEIMYKKEIKYKDKVKCFYSEDENVCTVLIKSSDSGEIHSIIKLYKS